MKNWFVSASNPSKRLTSATSHAFSVQYAYCLSTTPTLLACAELHMLKLSVGKGHQVIKQLCSRVLQYYATECAGYVLYRALVNPWRMRRRVTVVVLCVCVCVSVCLSVTTKSAAYLVFTSQTKFIGFFMVFSTFLLFGFP